MSNHLAIATVTKALVQILETAVNSAVSGASVVTKRPEAGIAEKTVDVFLYQVTPNAALRNVSLASRDQRGNVVNRPTCALDLHYLLSFYGDGDSYVSQRMLGAAVTGLLAVPGLTRERILSVSKDDHNDNMAASNLADAIEQVKFTPQALTLEELSRIWSIFYQVPYALSVAYVASVVILESEEPALGTQPVLRRGEDDRGVETRLGPFPKLESWHVGEGDDDVVRLRLPSYPSARLGTILTLRGQNLGGESVAVHLVNPARQPDGPGFDLPASPIPGQPGDIKISIPAVAADPSDWLAGVYSVSLAITSGGVTRRTEALKLPFAPQISTATAGARDGDGNVVVTVTAAPPVRAETGTHPAQTAFLLLPDRQVAASPRSSNADPLEFVVANPPANPGAAPTVIRLRVDEVDSLQFKGQGTPPLPVLDTRTIVLPP